MDLPGTDRRWGRIERQARLRLLFIAFLVPVWGYTATYLGYLDADARSGKLPVGGDVWTYLINLRTGIPPVLSALELLWWVSSAI